MSATEDDKREPRSARWLRSYQPWSTFVVEYYAVILITDLAVAAQGSLWLPPALDDSRDARRPRSTTNPGRRQTQLDDGRSSAVVAPDRGRPVRVRWSVAKQLLALQLALVVLAGLVAVTVSIWEVRSDVTDQTGRRCLSVARTLAGTAWVQQQLGTADPAATLQPLTERVRKDTGVDFITIMSVAGVRYTHPDPAQIGHEYLGTIAPAAAGGSVVETYTGTLGPSVRAVVPIRATPQSRVIALVAVGVTVDALAPEIGARIAVIASLAAGIVLLALLGTWLIGRRMRRLTHGLRAEELNLMHTYYDAVLHSVREGMVLLDPSGVVQLINDEAARLLGVGADAFGRRVTDLGLPVDLARALAGPESLVDAVHLASDRVLVVSALPAVNPSAPVGRRTALGRAITLRDHTELTELTSELGTSRALTEALKSQSHESANRLHAVITLVELGRGEEAIAFATQELRVAQQLTDEMVGAIADPVIAATLLGKAQVAAERGIEFVVTDDSGLDADALADADITAREMLTVVGNLIDNAFDAVTIDIGSPDGIRSSRPQPDGSEPRVDGSEPRVVRRVSVTVRRIDPDTDAVLVIVTDSGPGLDPDTAQLAFQRGWSTKTDITPHGHGLGLPLVGQIVARHHGRITIEQAGGAVFRVEMGVGLRRARVQDPQPSAVAR